MVADISGFRPQDVKGMTERVHAELLINELIMTLVTHSFDLLRVAESSREKVVMSVAPGSDPGGVVDALLQLFQKYSDRLMELDMSNICSCKACKNVNLLNLRVIVDSPNATLAKQLSETKTEAMQALWLTGAAKDTVVTPESFKLEAKERQSGDEAVTIWVHYPGGFQKLAEPKPEYKTLASKLSNEWFKIKGSVTKLFRNTKNDKVLVPVDQD